MKYLTSILFITILLISFSSTATPPKKILIIASNMIDMGDAEKHDARNNLWEVAPPYHIFLSHGYEVDFVLQADDGMHPGDDHAECLQHTQPRQRQPQSRSDRSIGRFEPVQL